MKIKSILFILVLLPFMANADYIHDKHNITTNKNIYGSASIYDVVTIPQKSKALSSQFSNKSKVSFSEYYASYFKPWSSAAEFDSKPLQTLLDKRPKRLAENYVAVPEAFFGITEQNANIAALGTLQQKAIIINNTNLRILPTNSYLFADINEPGEGYPFDYAQDDFLRIGEPILISHYTKDGLFAYVKTSAGGAGFVLAQDLVSVDAKFIATYRKKSIMLISDTLAHLSSQASLQLYMGSVLSLNEKNTVCIPIRNAAGKADLLAVKLPANNYINKPLAFSRQNVARIIDEVIGQPYGWGGNLFHMDCARLVRNYFAVFGVHMPLLSKDQAKQGVIIDVANMNAAQKKQAIEQRAVPYQSIIYLPGHIAIYMGKYKEEQIILHAIWGLKVFDESNIEYRYIIGKTIISTLSPGKELVGFSADKSNLLNKISVIGNF